MKTPSQIRAACKRNGRKLVKALILVEQLRGPYNAGLERIRKQCPHQEYVPVGKGYEGCLACRDCGKWKDE